MPDEPTKPSAEEATQSLISLVEAAKISGFSQGYLRRLMREGKISGIKIGRDWLTTEKAVRDYLSTERRPGPKRRED